MKLLCLDRPLPGASLEALQPHLLDEIRFAWAQYKNDFIREINFRRDRPGVAIIAECASVDQAKEILDEIPLAKAGLIDWDIIPLGPFVNWELLFAPTGD